MAKITLTDIASGYLSLATYNANNALIEAAIENTLSRDGTAPNTMSADLDLNSNKVTNLADATNNQDAVSLAQLNAASVVASTIAASAVTLADAGGDYTATTAEAAFAELAATTGAAIIGVLDSGGDFTGENVEAVLTELQANIDAISAGIASVAADLTPQLGGDLDLNGQNIVGADDEVQNVLIKDYGVVSQTLTVSANAVAVNLANGNTAQIDLEAATGAVTITMSGAKASGTLTEALLKIQQDTTANRTITFAGGTFLWPGGTQPTMTTGSDSIDIYSLKTWDGGTTWYCDASQAYS